MRSHNGCWTCRLRRKKCDEVHPICGTCMALQISCCYSKERPEWMDGGVKQELALARFRRQVKRLGHRRYEPRTPIVTNMTNAHDNANKIDLDATVTSSCQRPTRRAPAGTVTHTQDIVDPIEPRLLSPIENKQSDVILMTFYLEHLIPFLFPFYKPSIHHGGKAWLLDMMLKCRVVRQIFLCSSSYFLSVVSGEIQNNLVWSAVLGRVTEAFDVLRQAVDMLQKRGVANYEFTKGTWFRLQLRQ